MLRLILDFRSQRQDLNHAIVFLEKPKYFTLFSKIWWSMVSNTFCKSIKTIPVKRPFFKSGSSFISEMSRTSVSTVVFPKTRLKSVEKFVLTQKIFSLIMSNPFNNF